MAKISVRIDRIQKNGFFGYQVVPSIKITEVINEEDVIMSEIVNDFVKENEGEERYFDYNEAIEAKEVLVKRFEAAGLKVIDEGLITY